MERLKTKLSEKMSLLFIKHTGFNMPVTLMD